VPWQRLAVHCDDTDRQALANILVSIQMGIAVIDSAVAGLGGCLFAYGATGNVATEDVLFMLLDMGITTDVSLPEVVAAGRMISAALDRPITSRVAAVFCTNGLLIGSCGAVE
jgi:hydroxymethylglutaryl-CoA lyase